MDQLAAGVHQLRIKRFVNVYFVDAGNDGEWVLIDTGLPGSEKEIQAAATELFGAGAKPQAILLTHGHLDHLGSAKELAAAWQVPVIVHPLELPYVTNKAKYPPRDPTVGGSLAFMSRFFPTDLPDLTGVVETLNTDDETAPFLANWRWVHVPGHAPGQIAFFREADHTLIGADAFATTDHESVPSVLLGIPKISVAGAPFNYDWQQCRESVQKLAALEPRHIGCGHGPVLSGLQAMLDLQHLANDYPLPAQGRYIHEPARVDGSGVEHLPPVPEDKLPKQAAAVGLGLLLAGAGWLLVGGRRKKRRAKTYAAKPN
jgi:glyoxylase-like metal-dependent hydrolase (beta-lactamase superfamily II)